MSEEVDNTPISPMDLAKKLDIAPQRIYGLIRQGKVKDVGENKKKMVLPLEVVEALDSPGKRGRPSTKETLENFEVTPGTVLSWAVEVHKQVAVVEKQGEEISKFKGLLKSKDRQHQDIYMKNTSLAGHIKEGHIAADTDMWSILEAVVMSWRLNGREQTADALQVWMEVHRYD